MNETLEPGGIARRLLLRRALGTGVVMAFTGRAFAAATEGAQVVIDNFTFAPTPLTVRVGTTVTWANHDDMPHSIVCPALNMRSHPMDSDETFTYKFEQAGTYNYVCGLHPFMQGRVVVQA
jgi:plastocyanin